MLGEVLGLLYDFAQTVLFLLNIRTLLLSGRAYTFFKFDIPHPFKLSYADLCALISRNGINFKPPSPQIHADSHLEWGYWIAEHSSGTGLPWDSTVQELLVLHTRCCALTLPWAVQGLNIDEILEVAVSSPG